MSNYIPIRIKLFKIYIGFYDISLYVRHSRTGHEIMQPFKEIQYSVNLSDSIFFVAVLKPARCLKTPLNFKTFLDFILPTV